VARVLIDEPTEEIRELVARLVGLLGHQVIRTSEGELPDVVVFEPAAEGPLRRAQELRLRAPHVPIVACSLKEPSAETRALEPAAHLLKPFRLAELKAALDAALG
jgi:CheY-like chemotaxis protein